MLFNSSDVFASHYRAGEITYTCLSGPQKLYEITINTYTDPNSPADINTQSIQVDFGDFNTATVPRYKREDVYLSNNLPVGYIVKNIYVIQHSYASNGDFKISVTDQNRVDGIININGGDTKNIAFYIETLLHISSYLGADRSPILLIPPVDRGCGGFKYVYNPGGYDPDGDSLYFDLVTPMSGSGLNISGYSPPTPNFTINHTTGQIVWNTPPIVTGSLALTYNIAIEIYEWRGNTLMGYVERDMQIRIENCVNSPPVIDPMPNYCLEAGQSLTPPISVRATDPNTSQIITLTGLGAPFTASVTKFVATLSPTTPASVSPVYAQVSWKTDCSNIRYENYQLFIKATDNYAIPLSDYNFSYIKVIGPKPKNVSLTQKGNGFWVSWKRDDCGLASYYKIYKRIDSSRWTPDRCYRGVDPAKFTLIDSVIVLSNSNDTSYYDDNKGEGLSPLINYCYRIVAVYPPRDIQGNILFAKTADSYASDEICSIIIRSKPIITNVSVKNTNSNQGSIFLHWLKPITLDTVNYPPPYHLVLKRSTSSTGPYLPFDSLTYPTFSSINDSSYIDTLLNTSQNQYYYKIDFNSAAVGNFQFIDVSPIASSIRTSIYSTDRKNILSWNYKVPWRNNQSIVYRKNSTNSYDSLGVSVNGSFVDTGLVNGTQYCYLIKTIGDYSQFLYNEVLENFSQEVCGIPVDTIKPCAPVLSITPPCNSFNDFKNILTWVPNNSCSGDVIYYKIYYKRLKNDAYTFLDSVDNNTFQYIDSRPELKSSIAGCYVVTGVDSSTNHNESFFTNETCTDNCPQYTIPNVFTPNKDRVNDLLNPFPYRFVDKIDITIYDRWGLQVFETTNLDINWDGKDQETNIDCTDGIYFYICDIYEIFLEGVKKRTIRGTVQIMR